MNPIALLIVALGLLAAPSAADAQPPARISRIGMLMPVAADAAAPNIETFRRGLGERGYVEGQTIAIESRYSEGSRQQLPADEVIR